MFLELNNTKNKYIYEVEYSEVFQIFSYIPSLHTHTHTLTTKRKEHADFCLLIVLAFFF